MRTMRDSFLSVLHGMMKKNEKIIFITADFGAPKLDQIKNDFPDRFFNVGIAEQNMINTAAGFALEGFTVYCYAIAAFITMRCYEQIRVNLAITSQLRKINVNLVGVGAGFSYAVSGPSHHCLEDISIMSTLPNVEVFSGSDPFIAECFADYSQKKTGVKYFRFDSSPLPEIYSETLSPDLNLGFCELASGKDICVLSTGVQTGLVREKVKEMHKGHIDMFRLTDFNSEELIQVLKNYKTIHCLEESFRGHGLDSILRTALCDTNIKIVSRGCIKKYIFDLGTRDDLHKASGAYIDL